MAEGPTVDIFTSDRLGILAVSLVKSWAIFIGSWAIYGQPRIGNGWNDTLTAFW